VDIGDKGIVQVLVGETNLEQVEMSLGIECGSG
jgi:hypothetical protein